MNDAQPEAPNEEQLAAQYRRTGGSTPTAEERAELQGGFREGSLARRPLEMTDATAGTPAPLNDEINTLGVHPHILDVARRVHPTWLAAHGSKADRGVDSLAMEIGQCVAALRHFSNEDAHTERRVAAGHGILVTRGRGIIGYSVAVIAGELFDLALEAWPR